tara:strand:+ start:7342 stop:8232 length:891 start_codon:yes stop_codon:yes gene_type:complete
MAKAPMNVAWQQSNMNTVQGMERGRGDRSVAGDASSLANFSASFPSDAEGGSSEDTDFISFKAYSNNVPGYTSMTSAGSATAALEPQGNVKLFIPESLANSSKSNYEGTANGSLISGLANEATNLLDGEVNALDKILGIGTDAAGIVGGLGGDTAEVAIQAAGMTSAAANRHILFKGIEYRTFSYQYNIMPRTASESAQMADIIKWFRIQMLPDVNASGSFFTPPNYFEIEYFINGAPADYLHKIKPSVLTDCEVTFGGNGSFGKFKNTGAPSVIAMNLTFQEIQLVTKSDAAAGY